MKRASPFLAGLLLLFTTAPMLAATVTREAAPLPDLILLTDCGFLVDVTPVVNDEYAILFFDNSGNLTRIIVTGHLVVTFTNDATGTSYTANISGPAFIDFIRGTSTSTGLTGGPVSGLPGLSIFAGRVDNTTGVHEGRLLADVCALLAP
jgi:hypothetical protein